LIGKCNTNNVVTYPVALLDLTDDPEENIDIEEEEGVDQKKRVVDAP
jgi:hypothetical protein